MHAIQLWYYFATYRHLPFFLSPEVNPPDCARAKRGSAMSETYWNRTTTFHATDVTRITRFENRKVTFSSAGDSARLRETRKIQIRAKRWILFSLLFAHPSIWPLPFLPSSIRINSNRDLQRQYVYTLQLFRSTPSKVSLFRPEASLARENDTHDNNKHPFIAFIAILWLTEEERKRDSTCGFPLHFYLSSSLTFCLFLSLSLSTLSFTRFTLAMSWVGPRRFGTRLSPVVPRCAFLVCNWFERECPKSHAHRRVPARERLAPDRCCTVEPSTTHGVTDLVADNATPRVAPPFPRKRDDALNNGVADDGVIDRRRAEASLSVAVSRRAAGGRGITIVGDQGSVSEIFSRTFGGGTRERGGKQSGRVERNHRAEMNRVSYTLRLRGCFIATKRFSSVPILIYRLPSKHCVAREHLNINTVPSLFSSLFLSFFLSLLISVIAHLKTEKVQT